MKKQLNLFNVLETKSNKNINKDTLSIDKNPNKRFYLIENTKKPRTKNTQPHYKSNLHNITDLTTQQNKTCPLCMNIFYFDNLYTSLAYYKDCYHVICITCLDQMKFINSPYTYKCLICKQYNIPCTTTTNNYNLINPNKNTLYVNTETNQITDHFDAIVKNDSNIIVIDDKIYNKLYFS